MCIHLFISALVSSKEFYVTFIADNKLKKKFSEYFHHSEQIGLKLVRQDRDS